MSYFLGRMQECQHNKKWYLYNLTESHKDENGTIHVKSVYFVDDEFRQEKFSNKLTLLLISFYSCKLAALLDFQKFQLLKDISLNK